MKITSILSGFITICAASVFLAASYSQVFNKSEEKLPVMPVSVPNIIDQANAAIELYTKFAQLAEVRNLVEKERAVVGFYTAQLVVAADVAEVPVGITPGRARSLVGGVVALISVIIGGLAWARAAGRIGSGNGRAIAIVALVLGLIGAALSVIHLLTSAGGFGTGGGRAGAIVGLVLGLAGAGLGWLARTRSRHLLATE